MPVVIIRSGIKGDDGSEEILSEYLCDCPDCPNTAEHVLGFVREIGAAFMVCGEHAAAIKRRTHKDSAQS